MGVSLDIYLEPFIRVPKQYNLYEANFRTCGDHRNHNNDKFCPECGKEIVILSETKKSVIHPDDLIGNDNLWYIFQEEMMYLLSNKHKFGFDHEEYVEPIIITPELLAQKINEFEDKHKEDIDLLKEKLNIDVKVEFGYIQRYH